MLEIVTRLTSLMAVMSLACCACGKASFPPPIKPSADGRLVATVQPLRYELKLEIQPALSRFTGEVLVDVEVGSAIASIVLNASQLQITSATVTQGSESLAARVKAGDEVVSLTLRRPIHPGAARLHLSYNATMRAGPAEGVFMRGQGADTYVFTQFEPQWARRAFPCFDEPGFKTPWRVTLIVPAGLDAVSNMSVAAKQRLADGRQSFTFAETPPLPSYLVAFAVGTFDFVDAGTAGRARVPLRIILPFQKGAQAQPIVAALPTLVNRVEAVLGIPFPFPKLDVVAVPYFGSAMENAGLITADTHMVLSDEPLTRRWQRESTMVLAHEIAHQWFGDLVTPAWWNDAWLNESFATWMETKIVDELLPEWQVPLVQLDSLRYVAGEDRSSYARRIHEPTSTAEDVRARFSSLTYAKGAAVLAMFERQAGAAQFLDAVSTYLRRHARGTVTTESFVGMLDPPIQAALRTFLDNPGLPVIDVNLSCPVGEAPRLMLSQRRYDELSATGASERWQVPICVRYAVGNESAATCTVLSEPSRELLLAKSAGCPDWLVANENADGYYQVSYSGSMTESIVRHASQLTNAELIAFLDDLASMVRRRKLRIDDALRTALQLAPHENGFVVSFAVRLVADLADSDLVRDDLRGDYAQLILATFGERARTLGWAPRADDAADVDALRTSIVPLAAVYGEDEILRADATARVNRWLDGDEHAIDPLVRPWLLIAATLHGDRNLLERLRFKARRFGTDGSARRSILQAMGWFHDPALLREAMASVLSDEFPPQDGEMILIGAADSTRTRPLAYQFVKRTWPALAQRLRPQVLSWLVRRVTAFCDEDRVGDVGSFLRSHERELPDSKHLIDQTEESIHRCASYRASQSAAVERFLHSSREQRAN